MYNGRGGFDCSTVVKNDPTATLEAWLHSSKAIHATIKSMLMVLLEIMLPL